MAQLAEPPAASLQTEPAKRERTLTLADHLEELRRRLALCLIVLVAAVGVSFTQAERIIGWLRRPAEGLLPRFAFFTPTEPLLAYFKVSIMAGVILTMPVVLSQIWGFVRSGLTWRERYYGFAFIAWGSLLFVTGVAFAYYWLLPVSLKVLLGVGRGVLEPVVSINTYLAFVTGLAFWCGIVFEIPIVLFLLAKVGVVTPEWLRQSRSYAILVIFIIAAVVTPTTDPVNMILMAIPMVALYEVSIWVTRFAIRRPPHGGRS